jgi:hypothetical protein
MTVPYAGASSGGQAREEIIRILRRFGCESIGFMDDFEHHELLLAFSHRGRQVQMRANAKGWAQMALKEEPYTSRRRDSKVEYERKLMAQGLVAVNSILRDWIKGQMTAVECGILSFEAVFLPYMLTNDGRPVMERIKESGLIGRIEDRAAE